MLGASVRAAVSNTTLVLSDQLLSMHDIEIDFDFSGIDPSDLITDRHIRKTAERLVPTVLRQLGERRGRQLWAAALNILDDDDAPPPTQNFDLFVASMADRFVRLATPELADHCRKLIERRLHELVSGYMSVAPGVFSTAGTAPGND